MASQKKWGTKRELNGLQSPGAGDTFARRRRDHEQHPYAHTLEIPDNPRARSSTTSADAALSSAATNEDAGASSGRPNPRTDADRECLTVIRPSGAEQIRVEPGEASSTLTHPGQ